MKIEFHKNLKGFKDLNERFPLFCKYMDAKARPDTNVVCTCKEQRVLLTLNDQKFIYDLSDIGLIEQALTNPNNTP